MTNLRDRDSKRFRDYSRHTALETGSFVFAANCEFPHSPFDCAFFPSSSPKFYRRSYLGMYIPAQHRRSRRQRVASHTTQLTFSLHSIRPRNFCRGSPPVTGFNLFENSFPARENFATRNRFVSSTHNLQKLQNYQVSHTPIHNLGSRHTANDSQKLVPNNTSSSHTVTNFDEQTFETTRISFLDHLDECKKPLSTSYAIKNYL